MQFDQLRDAWRRELEQGSGGLDIDLVTQLVEKLDRDFEKMISKRDLSETGIALALMPFLIWLAFRPPFGLRTVGCVVIIAGLTLVVVILWRARRAGTDFVGPLSFAESLSAERKRIARQVRLLKSVAWWYVAPIVIGANLIFSVDSWSRQATVAYLIGTVLFGVFVLWLNQRAARRVLQPMLDEIDAVSERLASNG
jgi:hypothetical protein